MPHPDRRRFFAREVARGHHEGFDTCDNQSISLKLIAANGLVVRQNDPSSSTGSGKPLLIRSLTAKMLAVPLNLGAGVAKGRR